jgi:hypothetical protein
MGQPKFYFGSFCVANRWKSDQQRIGNKKQKAKGK